MKLFFRSRMGILSITIAAVVLLVVFQRIGALRPVENVLTTIASPVQDFFSRAAHSTKNITGYFSRISTIQAENDALQQRISELTDENLRLQNAITDATVVREELDYIINTDYQAITAKVIGRTADEYLRTIIINKGDRTGIATGYPVITGNGVVIGTVIDTNSAVSKVLLLNDNQSEISGTIQNEARSPGIIRGQYGLSLHMDLIPQNDSVSVGDTVATSGIEEFIPSDLIIGTINEVIRKEGELFQQATIEPLTDYDTVRIVSVIIPFNE